MSAQSRACKVWNLSDERPTRGERTFLRWLRASRGTRALRPRAQHGRCPPGPTASAGLRRDPKRDESDPAWRGGARTPPSRVPERLSPQAAAGSQASRYRYVHERAEDAVDDEVNHLAVRLRLAGVEVGEVPPPGGPSRGTELLCAYGVSCPVHDPVRTDRHDPNMTGGVAEAPRRNYRTDSPPWSPPAVAPVVRVRERSRAPFRRSAWTRQLM